MTDTCVTCKEPLVLDMESDEDDTEVEAGPSGGRGRTVPDSVELTCGCHFHWSVVLSMLFVPCCGLSSLFLQGMSTRRLLHE